MTVFLLWLVPFLSDDRLDVALPAVGIGCRLIPMAGCDKDDISSLRKASLARGSPRPPAGCPASCERAVTVDVAMATDQVCYCSRQAAESETQRVQNGLGSSHSVDFTGPRKCFVKIFHKEKRIIPNSASAASTSGQADFFVLHKAYLPTEKKTAHNFPHDIRKLPED